MELSKKLLERAEIDAEILDNGKAAPYSRFLLGIQVVKFLSSHLIEFRVTQNGRVLVQGNYQLLSILSETVSSFAKDQTTTRHIHIEYYPSHFYLSQDSIPVVFVHT